MLTSLVVAGAAAAEGKTEHELPIPPVAFGLTALGVFALLLLATFAFRGVANRH